MVKGAVALEAVARVVASLLAIVLAASQHPDFRSFRIRHV
jgi:hypothetical protein